MVNFKCTWKIWKKLIFPELNQNSNFNIYLKNCIFCMHRTIQFLTWESRNDFTREMEKKSQKNTQQRLMSYNKTSKSFNFVYLRQVAYILGVLILRCLFDLPWNNHRRIAWCKLIPQFFVPFRWSIENNVRSIHYQILSEKHFLVTKT